MMDPANPASVQMAYTLTRSGTARKMHGRTVWRRVLFEQGVVCKDHDPLGDVQSATLFLSGVARDECGHQRHLSQIAFDSERATLRGRVVDESAAANVQPATRRRHNRASQVSLKEAT